MDKYVITYLPPQTLKKYPTGKLDIFIHGVESVPKTYERINARRVIKVLFKKQDHDITIH